MKACKDEKTTKMTIWTADIVVVVVSAIWKDWRRNCQHSFTSRRLWLKKVPSDFQAEKVCIVFLRLVSVFG
jgi:hypothetical protein